MGSKKKKIPQSVIKGEQQSHAVKVKQHDVKIIGLVSDELAGNSKMGHLTPYVALKYFKSDWQCFSDWQHGELKEFSSFLGKLSSMTWQQVYDSSGKSSKRGMAYTSYKIDDVKSPGIKQKLKDVASKVSEDKTFFELRVNQNKLRVHGFQSQSAFFLVALDRGHEAFP
ncbi:hypothetical protein FR932_08830 [Moritella marina ATCC 15381]|uniref:Uncharacterized protein n=1 Tax=Moritella marina ATCC 15381 TaxID=1202962 RepID=A0A5J6WIQ1_MORMI|nr:hypothetical protein [Moritella marina]QFI37946.1 hypothetical protein FR932_08830 [Moritella marina ATCC 15381]